MFCLNTSSKHSLQKFEFSLKVKMMGSNLSYLLKFFLLYQDNWFIISILFYRYSPGNSGGELSSSPASSITSGSTRSHNHKDSKNLKQSNLPSTHPVSHGSWNPFSKKGSDKSNSKTSQHVTPHHINDNIILRW